MGWGRTARRALDRTLSPGRPACFGRSTSGRSSRPSGDRDRSRGRRSRGTAACRSPRYPWRSPLARSSGLVREAGRDERREGPERVLYELNPSAGWVVGIDVGRHWLRAAIADLTGQIVARRDERARVKSAADADHADRRGRARAGRPTPASGGDQVTFATVGSPGVFHPETRPGRAGAQPARVGAAGTGRGGAPRARHERRCSRTT